VQQVESFTAQHSKVIIQGCSERRTEQWN